MSDWASGYVSDVPYTAAFYHDQAPTYLNFICLLNGFQPRPLDQNFTYCELGCGRGLTTNTLAATNPLGRFYAADFHPTHIAEAQDTAAEAQLNNVTFFETSFEEILDDTINHFPMFDFITLHGVYSWVCPEDQQRIIEIIHRRLKPGGIVYISYNSLPGWSNGAPLQKLIYEYGKLFADRSDRRMEKALSFLQEFHRHKSPLLSDNQFLERIVDLWRVGRARYLTHEYMSENWHPQYHADVARELARAKLVFVGSANAIDNFPDLNLTKPQQALLSQVAAPAIQEMFKDYFVPRLLRKDVFVRGPRRLNRLRQEQLLKEMSLELIIPQQHTKLSMRVPIGEVTMDAGVFTPVLDALVKRPHTMAELLSVSGTIEKTGEKAAEIAGMLIGSWQAAPTLDANTTASQDTVNWFNSLIARQAVMDEIDEQYSLASPILGSAIQASGLEMYIYSAVTSDKPVDANALAKFFWRRLSEKGEKLVKNGQPLEGEKESLDLLKESIESIIKEKIPLWRNLGIVQ